MDEAGSGRALASTGPLRDDLLAAMRPWATGRTFPSFNGVEDTSGEAVRRGYRLEDLQRLRDLKARYDPDNRFRINFNIPAPNDAVSPRWAQSRGRLREGWCEWIAGPRE
jgi:hypothetical protein